MDQRGEWMIGSMRGKAGLAVAGLAAWCLGASSATAQINPYYLQFVPIPNGPTVARGCDLSSAGLGGKPVTAANQVAYAQCLVLGPQAAGANPHAAIKQLIGDNPVQLVMGVMFNSPAFLQAYPIGSSTHADQVTTLFRLMLFRDPTSAELSAYTAELDATVPLQYVFDALMDGTEFQADQTILGSALQAGLPTVVPQTLHPGGPYTVTSVTRNTPQKQKLFKPVSITAVFAAAKKTDEAVPFIYITNPAGTVVATFPAATYFRHGQTATTQWTINLSSNMGYGTFDLSAGLISGSGPDAKYFSLSQNFAKLELQTPYKASPAYTVQYNLTYGPGALEVTNVLTPAGAGPHPAYVMFHGGGWTSGDSANGAPAAELFAQAGNVVFDADYRLANLPDTSTFWNAQLQDAQLLVRWVRNNAAAFGVDPAKVTAFGSSSGGHLAVWTGNIGTIAAGDRAAYFPNVSPQANCVFDNSGDLDLTDPNLYTSAYPAFMGGALPMSDNIWFYDASPLFFVSAASSPVFILQGAKDPIIPAAQPMALQNSLQSYGIAADYVVTPGGHAGSGLSQAQENAYLHQGEKWCAGQLAGAP